ncbi:MAG: diguanylate cyclase [Geminicoccaceae bacterium]|nr:MAG: diguanylate cyclase [Geminicoccaceae bacterium]
MLQLRWDNQFQFAGYYAAVWQGYYAEAGLDVEIRTVRAADGDLLSVTEEVAAGRATFGIGGADVLLARDQGSPLVILASVFPSSLVAFYTRADSFIHTPRQMVGTRVLRRPNDLTDIQFRAVLQLEGLGLADVVTVEQGASGIERLQSGAVDVVLGYRMTAPFLADQLGMDLIEIRPETYGVDFYGDSLFTHADTVRLRPAMVDRFREASLAGWRYALQNPEAIARRIATELEPGPLVEDALAFNRFQATRVTAMLGEEGQSLGHVNRERWARMQAKLFQLGLVASDELAPAAFYTEQDSIERLLDWWRQLTLWGGVGAALLLLAAAIAYVRLLRRHVRRQAELLALSRWQLALTVDAAREGLFEWWLDTDRVGCRWGRLADTPQLETETETDDLATFLAKLHPADRPAVATALADLASAGGGYAEVEFRLGHGDAAPWFLLRCGMPPEASGRPAVFGVVLEITRRKRAEQKLERLAMQDPLTGLANRRCFDDALARALAKAARQERRVALALLDLDGFKPINDRFGHEVGDAVLQETARRLEAAVRTEDLVARLGGDEFAVLLEEMSHTAMTLWTERLLAALREPMHVDEHHVRIDASIGWTLFPDDAERGRDLMRHADAALYRAKAKAAGASRAVAVRILEGGPPALVPAAGDERR